MNCPTDSTLRAYIDAELNPLEISELKSHLQTCPACQARLQALSATALHVASQLAALEAPPSAAEANPQIALARFRAGISLPEERPPFFARIFARRWRFAWAASLAAAMLVFSLMFPATRGLAQRLLATLRVERVQMVSLDFEALTNTGSSRQPLDALAKLLSDNAVVTTNEKEFTVDSQSAATQAAGFPVRLLSVRTDAPTFGVSGAHAFHLTLDRSRLQDILDQAGRPNLLLPATLDGATVSVQIPRAVAVTYGTCKKQDQENADESSTAAANPCLVLIQAPSPLISVPSDLNIQQLAEIGLQFAGWDAVKAREYCQSVDWKSTLVVPIPHNVQSYDAVYINGVHGTLMHFGNSGGKRPSFALVWVDNGIIYSLIGKGDTSSAVQWASSLQ